jgi:hypothetical protein
MFSPFRGTSICFSLRPYCVPRQHLGHSALPHFTTQPMQFTLLINQHPSPAASVYLHETSVQLEHQDPSQITSPPPLLTYHPLCPFVTLITYNCITHMAMLLGLLDPEDDSTVICRNHVARFSQHLRRLESPVTLQRELPIS